MANEFIVRKGLIVKGSSSDSDIVSVQNSQTDLVNITHDGKVGIGIANPSSPLQIGGWDDGNNYELNIGWNAVSGDTIGTVRSKINFQTLQTATNNADIYKWEIATTAATASYGGENFGSDLAILRSSRDESIDQEVTMILNADGYVGVNNSSPNQILDVSGNIVISGSDSGLHFEGGNNRIYFEGNRALEGNSTGTYLHVGESYTITGISGRLNIGSVSSQDATWDNILVHDSVTKEVGYRTVSSIIGDELDSVYLRLDTANDPLTGSLEIDSGTYSTLTINGTSQGHVVLKSTTSTTNYQTYDMMSSLDKFWIRRLNDAGDSVVSNILTIDGDNVGIGTTTPNEALTIEGDISASGDITIDYNKALAWKASNNTVYNRIDSNHVSGYYAIRYRSNGGDNDATSIMHQWFTNKGGVSDTSVMALSRGGLLGIGTTSPTSLIHGITTLSGPSSLINLEVSDGGGSKFSVNYTGALVAASTGFFGDTVRGSRIQASSNGTKTLPAFSFGGQTTYGFYRSSNDIRVVSNE